MELYGLLEKEAELRLKRYGLNREPRESKFKKLITIFFDNFRNPFNIALLILALFSFFIGYYIEGFVLLFFLSLNVILISKYEFEYYLNIQKLKEKLYNDVTVIREGKKRKISPLYLVPGDIIVLKEGDLIPADGIVIEGEAKVNSIISEKRINKIKKGDYVFKGDIIKEGSIIIKIEKTGLNTKISSLNKEIIKIKKDPTMIEREINKFTYLLFKAFLFFSIIVLLVGLFFKIPTYFLVLLILSLGFAAIPQNLYILVALTLSNLAKEFHKEGIHVKKLNSIEDIGLIDYLIINKTDILMEDEFKIYEIIGNKEEILKLAALSSVDSKDPIDRLLLKYKDLEPDYVKPFNSKYKLSMAKLNELKIYKGSPEAIFELFLKKSQDLNQLEKWEKLVDKYRKKGLKIVLVGYENKENFYIKGLIALKPKFLNNIKRIIRELEDLGVKVIILTGDNYESTKVILKQLGINGLIINKKKLKELSDISLLKLINRIRAISDLSLEDKIRILKLLKLKGKVGIIDSKVEDSLILKKADVSIAIDNSSVIREIPDIILTKKDLALIKTLVKRSRNFVYSFKKLILYIIPTNLVELIISSIGVLLKKILLKPFQILWINLVTNSLPVFIFLNNEKEIKSKKEIYPLINIYDKKFMVILIFISSLFLITSYIYVKKNLFLSLIIWELLNLLFIYYYLEENTSLKQTLILISIFAIQLLIIILLPSIFNYSPLNEIEIKYLFVITLTYSILLLFLIEVLKLKKLKDEIKVKS